MIEGSRSSRKGERTCAKSRVSDGVFVLVFVKNARHSHSWLLGNDNLRAS